MAAPARPADVNFTQPRRCVPLSYQRIIALGEKSVSDGLFGFCLSRWIASCAVAQRAVGIVVFSGLSPEMLRALSTVFSALTVI